MKKSRKFQKKLQTPAKISKVLLNMRRAELFEGKGKIRDHSPTEGEDAASRSHKDKTSLRCPDVLMSLKRLTQEEDSLFMLTLRSDKDPEYISILKAEGKLVGEEDDFVLELRPMIEKRPDFNRGTVVRVSLEGVITSYTEFSTPLGEKFSMVHCTRHSKRGLTDVAHTEYVREKVIELIEKAELYGEPIEEFGFAEDWKKELMGLEPK